jgi:hypothetical protein
MTTCYLQCEQFCNNRLISVSSVDAMASDVLRVAKNSFGNPVNPCGINLFLSFVFVVAEVK